MKAHVLLVADGRSPTTRSWIDNIQTLGVEVSLISTFPCDAPPKLKHFHTLPIAFSNFSGKPGETGNEASKSRIKSLVRRFTPLFQALRYVFGPLSLLLFARTYRLLVNQIQPDIVHALRIPFEGMLGSFTPKNIPFLAATWGNDLTLHARGSWLMCLFTRRCLKRANGLTSDTHRDVRLAHQWGLNPTAPTLIVPGSGGLDLDAIDAADAFNSQVFNITDNRLWVVNPRGLRPGSVHQDVFFAAIPLILAQRPKTCFICPGLKGNQQIEALVEQLKIQEHTFLLTKLPQPQLWALFKKSQVFVSPSSHDGTPNTLLEAMACGAFPVAGDIESLREWVEPGNNGLLVNPRDPQQLAEAILETLNNPELRSKAADRNRVIIETQASQEATLPKIKDFYAHFLNKSSQ